MAPMDAVSPRGDVPSVVATASPPVPQVRVRVIEGHQLQGNDIKPVVTVLIGQKHFRTRIQTGNNPYYNEVTPGRGHGDPPVSPHPTLTSFCPFLGVLAKFPPDARPAGSRAHCLPGRGFRWH